MFVDRMPDEPVISVQLWASAKSVPETPDTHGLRHLLEHILVKGQTKDLDRRLETEGCFLTAQTFRDAMQIEVNVGPQQLDLAIKTLNELLKPVVTTQAEIDREVGVLTQEFAIYDDGSRLSAAAWDQAFGKDGLDPFGDLQVLKKATPEALKSIQRKQFYPEHLALVIAGPVDVKKATEAGVELIGMKQGANSPPQVPQRSGKPGRIEANALGEGRAALVGAFDSPGTVAALAAGLAVASEVEDSFVTYTPSVANAVITAGQVQGTSGMGRRFDGIAESDMPHLFAVGRYLAKTWYQRQMSSPRSVAAFRGQLLCQGAGYRPEQMESAIKSMTFEAFQQGLASFSRAKAVTVVGQ